MWHVVTQKGLGDIRTNERTCSTVGNPEIVAELPEVEIAWSFICFHDADNLQDLQYTIYSLRESDIGKR